MKVGVIGAGAVGCASLLALIMRKCVREVVIIDKNQARAKGVATDLQYGIPLSTTVNISAGDYADLTGAQLVIITAGINEKTGGATDRNDPAGRLKLLGTNAQIYQEIIPQLIAAAPNAVILVATDPPDPLADLVRMLLQKEQANNIQVISSGTYLDSLRFRFHIAQYLKINPLDVNAYVLGEHGTSSVFVWSSATVAGTLLSDILKQKGQTIDVMRQQIEREVEFANITIIEGINASQYGIGMVCARIAEIILNDEQTIIPIGVYNSKYGVTLTMPCIVGAKGVSEILCPQLSAEESQALQKSADKLKQAMDNIKI